MGYCIKVLFVDDDSRYAKGLCERVFDEFNIELTHYEAWDEAKTELFENPNKYSAIILDALGKLTQEGEGENQKHLTTALLEIEKEGINLPYFVLTAYAEKIDLYLPENIIKFNKKKEEEKLFTLIREKFKDSVKNAVAQLYSDELGFIEENYQDEQLKYFIELFSDINGTSNVFEDLTKLRVLNEKTMEVLGIKAGNFKNLDELIYSIDKAGCYFKEGSKTVDILLYFSKKIIKVPEGIFHNIKAIYDVASSVSVHARKPNTYVPTCRQIISFKYGFLETISWVDNTIRLLRN
jgi:hypothetical protein